MLDGFNATVFAYGCTGAGKTYTMIGSDQEGHQGIMFLTLQDLFKQQRRVSGVGTHDMTAYRVTLFRNTYNIDQARTDVNHEKTHASIGQNDRQAKRKAGDIL